MILWHRIWIVRFLNEWQEVLDWFLDVGDLWQDQLEFAWDVIPFVMWMTWAIFIRQSSEDTSLELMIWSMLWMAITFMREVELGNVAFNDADGE